MTSLQFTRAFSHSTCGWLYLLWLVLSNLKYFWLHVGYTVHWCLEKNMFPLGFGTMESYSGTRWSWNCGSLLLFLSCLGTTDVYIIPGWVKVSIYGQIRLYIWLLYYLHFIYLYFMRMDISLHVCLCTMCVQCIWMAEDEVCFHATAMNWVGTGN